MRRFVIECEFGDYRTQTPVTFLEGTDDWPGLAEASTEIAVHRLATHGNRFDGGAMQLLLREVTAFGGADWITEAATSSAGAEGGGGREGQ